MDGVTKNMNKRCEVSTLIYKVQMSKICSFIHDFLLELLPMLIDRWSLFEPFSLKTALAKQAQLLPS